MRELLDLAVARRRLVEDGFAHLGALLDEATVERLRGDLRARFGPDPAASGYGLLHNNLWREAPAFEALVRDGGLARLVRDLRGADEVVYFQDNLVWKRPGATERVEWHQDYSYWPLSSPAGLTVWIALDEADAANGCMHYLPGTHRLGECAPQDFVAGATQAPRDDLPPLDARGREHEAVAVAAAPGDVVVHDPLVWHMSPGNSSDRERRAWSLSWILPSNRWDPGHSPHPFNYQYSPRPGSAVEGELFPSFSAR